MRERITVSSTAWIKLSFNFIANSDESILVTKPRLKNTGGRRYYESEIDLTVDEENLLNLHSLIEHHLSYCDSESCQYCKEAEE